MERERERLIERERFLNAGKSEIFRESQQTEDPGKNIVWNLKVAWRQSSLHFQRFLSFLLRPSPD